MMSEPERLLSDVSFVRTECDLLEPYVLSFTTITGIVSLGVRVLDNRGNRGVGETVPLPGYANETEPGIVRGLESLCSRIRGLEVSRARALLSTQMPGNRFAVSALSSAVDLLSWPEPPPGAVSIPLVFPLTATGDERTVLDRMEIGLARGYRHFKMKIGWSLEGDIRSAEVAAREGLK